MQEQHDCEYCGEALGDRRRGTRFCSTHCRGVAYRGQVAEDAMWWRRYVHSRNVDLDALKAEIMNDLLVQVKGDVRADLVEKSKGKVYHLALRRLKDRR